MEEIEQLKQENDDLKLKLFELSLEMNYSVEKDVIEFLRSIYDSVISEIKNDKSELTKKELLFNLKTNILDFAKEYKIML